MTVALEIVGKETAPSDVWLRERMGAAAFYQYTERVQELAARTGEHPDDIDLKVHALMQLYGWTDATEALARLDRRAAEPRAYTALVTIGSGELRVDISPDGEVKVLLTQDAAEVINCICRRVIGPTYRPGDVTIDIAASIAREP